MDTNRGFYNKYCITKRDGSPIDPNACYFVMRIDTDPHARKALRAYIKSVRKENLPLASDLTTWLKNFAEG